MSAIPAARSTALTAYDDKERRELAREYGKR